MSKKRIKNDKSNNSLKTNQVLTRKMGDFDVFQRTKDGMFNATTLLKQWNENTGSQKQMIHFTENKNTEEFVKVLISKEDLKERNSVLIQSRGKNGGTWMHPFLFIDFAMWINPEFKYDVIKFVYDELIKYRVDAGIEYKEVGRVISSIVDKSFIATAMSNVSKAINHIVFGGHESGIRNKQGCESKMRKLLDIEKNIVMLIDCGFVNSYDQLMNYLRKEWVKRWQPFLCRHSQLHFYTR